MSADATMPVQPAVLHPNCRGSQYAAPHADHQAEFRQGTSREAVFFV